MKKHILNIVMTASVIISSTAGVRADNSYSNAVVALNPVAYWPLNETTSPPHPYLATNSGTLGPQADGYYNNAYYPNDNTYTTFTLTTFFTGPVPGVTSDGDAAAQFNGGQNNNDNSGYLLIPDINHDLDAVTVPFTAEAWVMPEGGDPNDPSGASYASTEWTGIIKKGGGGAFYTETGDAHGGTYGWTVALAGIYALGAPVGWYGGTPYTGPLQLKTNACWVVDFYNGSSGNTPSLEFDVPLNEPTPEWFHLVLAYDGTNANFYVNGELTATTVPGLPQSTNSVFAPGAFPTSASGAYQFTTANGVGYAPDTINPICLGNINESYSFVSQGFPAANAIGFNCQLFNGAMDEVAVYTNAFPAATVLKHYQDATAADKTAYTNDVLSATPPVYLRLDEPAYVDPSPSTFPAATNYGSLAAAADGLYEPGVKTASPGPVVDGFGSQSYAAQFNGLDAAIDIGNGAFGALSGTALDPQGSQPFSVAFWFKGNPADCYGRFQTILGRGDSAWRSSIDGSGEIHWNPGAGPEITSPQNFNDGAWHQAVGVSDGTTAYLYVDGQLSVSATGVGSLAGSPDDLFIGGAPDYTTSQANGSHQRYFAGAVTQVAFFDTALSGSQVESLFSAADSPPTISLSPKSVTIGLGSSGTLTTTASGSVPLSYQWYLGTTPLSDVAGNIIGSATPTLTITNALVANGGNYTLVVTNSFGSLTSAVATVTISLSPTVLIQPTPANTILYAGNQATFGLAAVGASPLYYQWYSGSSAISGATATNIGIAALVGTNKYTVVVTNTYGSATSAVVTVVGQAFVPPASGFTVNFDVAQASAASAVYVGQGAYSDPGHNTWNPFPAASGTPTGLAYSSASNLTLVTATLYFGFNNGATGGTTNGTPSWLLSYEDAVNTNSPAIGGTNGPEGELIISDLPKGTYSLYIYGANYDNTRGSLFSIAPTNGGAADQGINGTVNGSIIGNNAIVNGVDTFAEGDNYVIFTNVVTDASGDITFTYIPNPADDLTGEAPFNGVQVVGNFTVTTQPTVAIQKSGTNVIISWSSATGVLQSATSVSGPYTDVTGATSPYTAPAAGTLQFFRLRIP